MEDITLTYKGHYIEIWRDRAPLSLNYLDPLVQVAVLKRDSMGYEVPLSHSTESAQFPLEIVRRILEEGTDDPEGHTISDGWWIFGVSHDGTDLERHRLPKPGEFRGFKSPEGIVAVSHDVVPTAEYAAETADRILKVHNRIMAGMVYGYTIYSETVCTHQRGFTCDLDRVIGNALADVDDLLAESR